MSLVITIDPCPTKFVGDMVDMIVSTDEEGIEFKLKQGDDVILEESYVPSAGTVRIGGLGKVIDGILYGQMLQEGGQDYMKGTFKMLFGSTVVLTKTLYISHRRNMEDVAGSKKVLTHGGMDVCYPGKSHPLTFIGTGTARLYNDVGSVIDSVSVGNADVVYTQECQPEQLFPLTYDDGVKIVYTVGSDTLTSHIDPSSYPDGLLFRFLNIYDAPETLLAKKALSVKPAFTDEIGVINGEQQRFGIDGNDEFTAESGALAMREQYLQWHDLLMSRKVEVYFNNQWLPVIITKANYSEIFRKATLDGVSFNFKLANNQDTMI